jgi:hypothetical protein
MKTRTLFAVLIGAFVVPLAACDIDQTEAGEMPEVDVDVRGGELPEYDVDAPEVEVGTTEDTVVIERPTVDVDPPVDNDGR